MNKRILILPFLVLGLYAQENIGEEPVVPVITDLDLLVESVKNTASIRAKEDRERLNKFLSDKNRQQYLLNQMKKN